MRYNPDGSYVATLVSENDLPVSLFAPDGSVRVTLDSGEGVYAPNGALRVGTDGYNAYTPDGSGNAYLIGNSLYTPSMNLLSTNRTSNPSYAGAVQGSPGVPPTNWSLPTPSNGLSRSIVSVGIENGSPYVDVRYAGTTTAASFTNINTDGVNTIPIGPGREVYYSVYLAVVGGSISPFSSVTSNLSALTSASSFISVVGTASIKSLLSADLKRFQIGGTTPANTGYIRPAIQLNYGTGVVIDVTLRIYNPQVRYKL